MVAVAVAVAVAVVVGVAVAVAVAVVVGVAVAVVVGVVAAVIFMQPVRHTFLRQMRFSPAHYRAATGELFESTAPQRVGFGTHAILFNTPLHVYEGERRGNAWKEFLASDSVKWGTPNEELHKRGRILTTKEYERSKLMAEAVLREPLALPYLEGMYEQTLEWKFLGQKCRGTVDVLGKDFITELKTCASSDPRYFARKCVDYAYHAQLAYYRDAAVENKFAIARDRLFIIAVESKPPFPVTVFRLTDRLVELGEMSNRSWFESLLICNATGNWPAYAQTIVELDVPEFYGGLELDDEGVET